MGYTLSISLYSQSKKEEIKRMPMPSVPVEVFCSFADADRPLLEQLEQHLSLLRHQGLITIWHQRQIHAGTNWKRIVKHHLNTASVILLLISSDFLASDYCYSIEMQYAIQRHHTNEARVIPILLRPADWQETPFGKLKVLPSNGKPISTWNNRDSALLDVTRGIRAAIEEIQQFSTSTPHADPYLEYGIPKRLPSHFSFPQYSDEDRFGMMPESEYAQYQERLYRELKKARLQADPDIPVAAPLQYRIDKSFFLKFNLSDQRMKFLKLLEGQLKKQYQGAVTCAITADARNILRGYILQRMIIELEQRNGRRSNPPYEVLLTSNDIRDAEQSIERKILSALNLNHLADLFADNAHADIILVIWCDRCLTKLVRPAARSFEMKLKEQIKEILRQQNRCLLLFWVTVGQPALYRSIALPRLEDFDVEALTTWLNEQIEIQLNFQGTPENIIRRYLTILKDEISRWEGDPAHTYEILQDFLAKM